MERRGARFAWLDERATRLADLADRHGGALAATLAVLAALSVLPSAVWKPLWYDELFTFHLSRLPSPAAIWQALANGLDQQPFPYFVAHHAAFRLLGEGAAATRLPEILGFALLTAGVFGFVSHRAGAVCGALAAVACWMTEARHYATEARPYALLAGFTALSFLCWQRATDPERRVRWLVALAASLAAAVSSHYYAVLVLAPLGAGELCRTLLRRRLDPAVWLAFGGAALPIAIFLLPILGSLARLRGSFWSPPSPSFPFEFYGWLLEPAALPLAATLIGVGLWLALGRPGREAAAAREATAPVHELVAAVTLALLPFLGLALALLATNALNERYVLPAVVGLAILFGFGARAATARPGLLLAWLVLLLGVFAVRQTLVARWVHQDRDRHAHVTVAAADDEPELPIVVQDPLLFLEYAKNVPSPLADRLRYLASPEEQRAYTGFSNVDPGLLLLREYAPIAVLPAAQFLSEHEQFYVLWTPGRFGWILQKLAAEGARLDVKESDTGRVVVRVDRRPQGAAAPR